MNAKTIARILGQHCERGYEYGPDDLITVTCDCGYESASEVYEARYVHIAAEEIHARHQAKVLENLLPDRHRGFWSQRRVDVLILCLYLAASFLIFWSSL